MAKKEKQAKKKIFLSDVLLPEYFDNLIGQNQYHIFDKDELIRELGDQSPDVISHLSGGIIEKNLTKTVRNKKIKNIVYLLYTSIPIEVKQSINDKIISKLGINIGIEYNLITTNSDFQTYKYKNYSKSDFSNIYFTDYMLTQPQIIK